MTTFNRVILLGQLTTDPELRYSPAGNAWTTFPLLVTDRHQDRHGETVDADVTVHVVAYGRQAEIIAAHLAKGSSLMVEGRMAADTWEGRGEEQPAGPRVILRRFQFVGGRVDT